MNGYRNREWYYKGRMLKCESSQYWSYQSLHSYSEHKNPGLRQLLVDRGYAFGSGMTRAALLACLKRSDSGLLSYTGRANSELRDFIQQRRLETNFKQGNIGTRTELVQLLNAADEDPRFHRFMELPAEIRGIVYRFYLDEPKKRLLTPKQPPLLSTNRLIREEALPLFYSKYAFAVQVVFSTGFLRPLQANIAPESLQWLQCTHADNLAMIRNLHVLVMLESHLPRFRRVLNPGSGCIGSVFQWYGKAKDAWEATGVMVLRFAGARSGRKLRMEDFLLLREEILRMSKTG